MSRLILIAAIAVLGVGAYLYMSQPEPTPAEKLQSAAQDAGEAVSEAATAAQEAASTALSAVSGQATEAADQAGQAATDLANQAGDQVAALSDQGQQLFDTWIRDGMLTADQFDYDKMVDAVRNSQLSQDVQAQIIKILDEIKTAPETAALKLQDLRNLMTQ